MRISEFKLTISCKKKKEKFVTGRADTANFKFFDLTLTAVIRESQGFSYVIRSIVRTICSCKETAVESLLVYWYLNLYRSGGGGSLSPPPLVFQCHFFCMEDREL